MRFMNIITIITFTKKIITLGYNHLYLDGFKVAEKRQSKAAGFITQSVKLVNSNSLDFRCNLIMEMK